MTLASDTDKLRQITGAGASAISDNLDLCINVPLGIHENVFQARIVPIILGANDVHDGKFTETDTLELSATAELLC